MRLDGNAGKPDLYRLLAAVMVAVSPTDEEDPCCIPVASVVQRNAARSLRV